MKITIPDFGNPETYKKTRYQRVQRLKDDEYPYAGLEVNYTKGELVVNDREKNVICTLGGEMVRKIFTLLRYQPFEETGEEDPKYPQNCAATMQWLLENRKTKDTEAGKLRKTKLEPSILQNLECPFGIEWIDVVKGKPRIKHAAVALAPYGDKDFLIFEKLGYGLPYNMGFYRSIHDFIRREVESLSGVKLLQRFYPAMSEVVQR